MIERGSAESAIAPLRGLLPPSIATPEPAADRLAEAAELLRKAPAVVSLVRGQREVPAVEACRPQLPLAAEADSRHL